MLEHNNDIFWPTQTQNVATESILPTILRDSNLGGIDDIDTELVCESNVNESHKEI